MLLLGIDIGTSSVKVSVVDAGSQQCIASAQYPEIESPIISRKPGWAEQSPATWWNDVQEAILKVNASKKYNPADIRAIGIAYQMHGLVCVDSQKNLLRDSIIWCDSRAVTIGEQAFAGIGEENCLNHLLNSPGNFTASKLAWVKENEPEIYSKIDTVMLPGDFIAMKMTGEITTSVAALSEGIFWDFQNNSLSEEVFTYYGFNKNVIPAIHPVFGGHGSLLASVASHVSLTPGIPVTYKAGDQPNNALSLSVLEPGEVAATAGTSAVIYSVSDQLAFDKKSRVNSFAHVNYTNNKKRIGVLLCVNGCGIMNRYVKDTIGNGILYAEMNGQASGIEIGSANLTVLPFGNGAERLLGNKTTGASLIGLDLNKHTPAHIFRATQEGIANALQYGLECMRENNIQPTVIRAGHANMFLSDVFATTFVNVTGVPVELYSNDSSVGAALGAGIGAAIFSSAHEAFSKLKKIKTIEPQNDRSRYETMYRRWVNTLDSLMEKA